MRLLNMLLLFVMSIVGVGEAILTGQPGGSARERVARALPRGSRLVDVTVGPGVSSIPGSPVLGLVVNRDDDVLSCAWTVETLAVTTLGCTRRGQAVVRSGRLELEKHLPGNEVPFMERRVTTDSGVWHVVLSWRMDRKYGRGAEFWTYILMEAAGGVKQVVREQGDIFLGDFLLQDINGDGIEEVVVSGHGETGISGWMSIWALKEAGCDKIGFKEHLGFNPSIDKVPPFDISTHEIKRRGSVREVTTYHYLWDQGQRRYVFLSKVVEECRYPDAK